MKKLFLFLVIAAGAIGSVPPLKERAQPFYGPVLERAADVLDPVLSRALDPVFRWSARNETEQLIRLIEEQENAGQPLPRPTQFSRFIEENNLSGRGANDPWGSPYYLQLTRREIRVGSAGADLTRDTPDDVVAMRQRRR